MKDSFSKIAFPVGEVAAVGLYVFYEDVAVYLFQFKITSVLKAIEL